MKQNQLIIKRDLMPWYNELDDKIDLNYPGFPYLIRKQILAFGEYVIASIDHQETYLVKREQ